MRKAILIISALVLLTVLPAGQASAMWPFKRKKEKTQEPAGPVAAPVVSPYEKLILNAKGRVTKDGSDLKIHKIGDKLYLEIRDDRFGREVLLSSYLDRTGDLTLAEPGTQAMTPARYTLEKTDSLVLLRRPTYNIHVTDGDANIARALEMSRAGATVMAFPIASVNYDSTGVVFEATKLLTAANRDVVDMTGKQLSGDFRVSSSRPDTKYAFITGIGELENGVSASFETGLKLEATGMMGFMSLEMEATVAVTAYLTMLPRERMSPREADSRIGTGYYPFTGFSADGSTRQGWLAKRMKLEPATGPDSSGLFAPRQPVTIYVDTLFNERWYDAVREGIEAWDGAFEKAGFRDVLQVVPYPSDERWFNANDPTLKTVRYGQGTGSAVSYQTFDDPRTGEIVGFSITVPRDYVKGLRRNAVNTISETDARYREYFLPDDAVCEGLRAEIIRTAGLCFGLAPNYAGSFAYTPAQVRDPQFTREKGFTASVLDGVMFNFVARPGDRERGVQTVVTKPGVYDEFAIRWLYSSVEGDEKTTLDSWLREKEGQAEYLYVRPQSARAPYDPRAFSKDLTDDIFTSTDNLLQTVKFVMANGDRWLEDERIPGEYKTLFPDYAILRFDDIILSLCNYIGGIYINESVEGSDMPFYRVVPKETQRRAMLKILSLFDDLSWMDSNPRLMDMAGMDKRISRYVANNWPVRYVMMRILGRNGAMGLAVEKSGDPYTQQEAMKDLSDYIFRDVSRGREMTDISMAMARTYIDQLISAVPVLKSNYEKAGSSNGFTGYGLSYGLDREAEAHAAGDIFPPVGAMGAITSLEYHIPAELGPLCIQKLKEARISLVTGLRYCRTQYMRDKYGFYISKIDMALEGGAR